MWTNADKGEGGDELCECPNYHKSKVQRYNMLWPASLIQPQCFLRKISADARSNLQQL